MRGNRFRLTWSAVRTQEELANVTNTPNNPVQSQWNFVLNSTTHNLEIGNMGQNQENKQQSLWAAEAGAGAGVTCARQGGPLRSSLRAFPLLEPPFQPSPLLLTDLTPPQGLTLTAGWRGRYGFFWTAVEKEQLALTVSKGGRKDRRGRHP